MEDDWVSYKGDKLIQPKDVKGFNKLLDSNKQLFELFLKNFYRAWEYPENHVPINVFFKKDKINGDYLRVDFKDNEWYHVKGPNTWF